MISNAVRAAIGDPVDELNMPSYNGYWAEIILHAEKEGEFVSLEVDDNKKLKVIETDLWIKPGDKVHGFSGANQAIGTLVLRFENEEDLEKSITNLSSWLKIIVK